jgi:SAM-dependent methyltransferase
MPQPALSAALTQYLQSDAPQPLHATHIIGDGDFRAIGAEFLEHLVRLGGLRPEQRVLDIGCGFGRMALPLTCYLGDSGRYLGFDIVQEPIDWCRQQISPRHSGFRFEWLDFRHPLYNTGGGVTGYRGFRATLPGLEQLQPDFVFAVSVFTHLEQTDIEHYLADISRLLPSGGTLLFTAFLLGQATPPLLPGCVFPTEAWRSSGGPLTALIGAPLTAAVGIEANWLQQQLTRHQLLSTQLHFGHWRWGHGVHAPFQDILVCRKV